MPYKSQKYLLPALVSLLFLSVVFYFFFSILADTGGHYVYPLDDTYIHLAVAKNWVATGVPGVNAGDFAYLTSSPFWTTVLYSVQLAFTDIELFPLILNIVIAVFLIFYLYRVFSQYITPQKYILFALILIIFSVSIPLLTFMGMEHLLHSLLFLIFLLNAYKLRNESGYQWLYVITFILPLIRFESLFAVAAISLWLLYIRKIKRAVILILIGILPVILLGFYSLTQGGTFLPTSILLKGEFFGNDNVIDFIKSVLWHPIKKLSSSFSLAVLFFTALALLIKTRKQVFNDDNKLLLLFFVLTAVFHLLFAQVGWLYRYEAYLILSGTVVLIINFADLLRSGDIYLSKFSKFFITLLLLPLFFRAYDTNSAIRQASVNIYEQQWQTADFFGRYYTGETVAVNDIGLVAYRGNVEIFDLWGLANKDVAFLRLKNKLDGNKLDSLLDLNNVKIAAIYKQLFDYPSGFYRDWHEVGSLTIRNNIACGEPEVVFFAKDSAQMIKLVKNLIDFSSSLPENVIKKINYKLKD